MFIKKITLNNYRIYKGNNTIELNHNPHKNLFVVAGNNGYGKTSFLTALIWCLYGKKISEVEEAYRKEIYAAGGYKYYAFANLNKLALEESTYSYFVEIAFRNFNIPFLNTEEVVIRREYDVQTDKEAVSINIDGYENELTKEVGPDIFINDFILPKEIAKFFFFDSEKIVSIAESKSIDEMKSISRAYSEVLGIKKYEDLRNNLKDLRLRFKQESATREDKIKFDLLQKELDEMQELIKINKEKIEKYKEEKEIKRTESLKIQERLIREGQALTIQELNGLRKENERLIEKSKVIRKKLNELIELIPFALVSDKLELICQQIEKENKEKLKEGISDDLIAERINYLFKDKKIRSFIHENVKNNVKSVFSKRLNSLLKEKLINNSQGVLENNIRILHSFTSEEQNEFMSILNIVKGFFKEQFNLISAEHRQNQIDLRKISKKLSDAEKKEDDLLISSYRSDKELLESEISVIDDNIIKLLSKNETLEKEVAIKQRQLSELAKYIKMDSDNILKDETVELTIEKLDAFLIKFKKEKKDFLESKIFEGLKVLMHKKEFISKVTVNINNDLVDINLFNKLKKIINKNELSKGEQQLYATAILKALVEESNIKFPVFIDSPLQKFDIKHSKNVIQNFYPKIAEQVVICPLLEKELTEREYSYMMDNIENTFLIVNKSDNESIFTEIDPKKLFKIFKEQTADVF